MRDPVASIAGPDGNLLALAQISALRRAAGILLVALAFLSLHFALDHGAAVARQRQQLAAQPQPASQDMAVIRNIGL